MEDEVGFAEKMNSMPKYVYSTTLTAADWQNSTIVSGDFAASIAKVKEEVDGVILVAGSAHLVQGLIAADLLDELRLMVFPVILGGGKRLFAEDGRKVPLALTDARTIGAGVQLLTYERTAA
jgi:dihydrofolate reductase